jgi:hypothetical protein
VLQGVAGFEPNHKRTTDRRYLCRSVFAAPNGPRSVVPNRTLIFDPCCRKKEACACCGYKPVYIYIPSPAAGIGRACGPGASPTPGLRVAARDVPTYTQIPPGCTPRLLYRTRAAAGIGSACGPGASPTPDLRVAARDVPHMRKYRRAARLGCNGWGSVAAWLEFDSSNHGIC